MGSPVLELPRWVLTVRGFQLFFSVIILGMCADGIYWIAYDSWIFALFTSLCTWIIVLYTILSSTVNSCKAGYHYWAVLALEIFMIIFWLASMGALAATRATFIYPTRINDCVNLGVGDSYCDKLRRRGYVASDGYLAMMSGAAGLSALEMILFITTLTVHSIHLKRYRSGARPTPLSDLSSKPEGYPLQNPVYYNEPQPPQQQYTDGQYPQQPYVPPYGAPPDAQGYPQQPNQPPHRVPVGYQQYAPVPGG